jgi:protein-S-isoprenylcysteine O-methyltransferase Ste14
VIWFASWILAALWQNAAVSRASLGDEVRYRLFLMPGIALLFLQAGGWAEALAKPRIQMPMLLAWAAVGLVLAGFAWMWWARVHLGRMWSSSVALKADHKIVRSGPYAITRHPIYTGLLLAVVGTAAVRPSISTALGVGLFALGIVIKLRQEERLLMTTGLAPDYQVYRTEVPTLLPFVKVRLSTAQTPDAASQRSA